MYIIYKLLFSMYFLMNNNNCLKKMMKNDDFSLIKAILIYYFFMLQFSEKTFTKSVQNNIISDIICKHIIKIVNIGIILRYILKISNIDKLIMQTFISYILFIFLSKMESEMSLITIGVFIIYFILDTKMEYSDELNKKIDKILDENEKIKIHKKHNINRGIIVFILFSLMIMGCSLYGKKKIIQYGGNFKIGTFIS